LAGLLPPTHGAVLLDGRDIHEDIIAYKSQVGYVPEEAYVYTYLTAPEYLRLCGRLRHMPDTVLDQKTERLLSLLKLDGDRHATLATFSKGMRQKVLLAAALLHNPRILILDEPLSGLDVSTALVVRAIVKALARDGRLIFYSSHDLDTVEKISTRVMILRAGEIVADDSAGNLRSLTRLPSLEDVFAQLAVKDDVENVAGAIVDTLRQ
jgi:ABC-2 type transport system ATP-binding protein